ncbi:MAG: PKD domain-containing protein, partial [Bacteroidota bacterium]|nr:PKD domain-containing protein [Bacteroidota bacterium]
VAAGCPGPTQTISVVVNPAPAAPTAGANSPLCTGQTLSLTATFTAGATYSLTGPNGFSSALQNPTIVGASPLATGLYSVVATMSGCPGPVGTVSVNVSTPPIAPSAGANSPLCVGQTLNLTATFTAGLTYSWSGPNTFTSNLQNPSIAGISSLGAGTYSVFATTAGGCAGPTGTINVVVNNSPSAPTAGANSPLCAGQTLNLTSTFTAGATYSWTGPNTFTSNVQNPSISGITVAGSGVYSVIATLAGCPGPAGTISVTVNPIPAAPTAAANAPLCVGQTMNLTSTFSTGATYSWTGPNSFTSTLQNPSIIGVTLLASGTYSVSQTILGCSGPAGVVTVTINPIPAPPTITSNAPICALQSLFLNANPGGATYNWTGPNSFTSTVQNPTIVTTSTLNAGTYSVTQTLLGCTSPAASLNIVINNAAATPTATSNSPICLGQNINLNQTPIGSATYSWSGPNSFTSSVQNPTIVGASTLATGVYSVFATVAGCPGQTSTLSVLVSSPGTVAAVSPTVCANNALVVLNGTSSTGSGTWTSSGSGVFSPNSLTGNYTPSSAEISAGTSTLTLISTNNGGCAPVTTTTSILITPAPSANAGSNQTVCANNATVSLSGSVSIASGGSWSSSGTGTFVPNNNVLNPSYVPSTADISSGSFTLTLSTTGNGNCLSENNSIVITISPAPVVNPGPNPQAVCKNNPNFQLNGSSTTGSGVWASSGTGTFSASNNILNPTYIPSTADTLAGSVTLTLTSTNNGGCNLVSQTMSIVYVSTLAVNAGGNQTVCSNNASVPLNGVSTTSAGVWTSSGTGTFSPNANLLSTNYVPSAADILAGGVTLTLTTTNNGGCNPISTTMSITITPGPTANAGSNQTVCANNATVALTGSFTIAGGGIWTSSGTGTFSPNTTSMNVNYIASSADTTAGSVIITLSTTSNGNCNATTNTMVINFTPAPLVNPGNNISVCKTNAVAVLNGYSSTGSGTWTTSGTGTFTPSNAVLNPSYTPSSADTTAGSVTLSLTSVANGGCNAVTQTLTITYSGIPTVTAGLSQTVCANNSNVILTGTASTGSGTWTSSGTGTFVPNTQNGIYVPSSSDITGGSVTLTLTSTNNGGCLSVAQQMTVDFTPAPQVNAGASQTLCSNTQSINLSGTFTIATGGIWSSSGTGTFTPNNTTMIVAYIPTSADTAAGNVTIYLTSTGNGNCLQVVDSVKVSFIKAPFATVGGDISLCPYSPSPILNGNSSVSSFTWATSGSGSFSPSNTILNPAYIPSAGDISAGTVTISLVTASATCGSASDSLLITFRPKPSAAFTYTNRCVGATTSFTDVSLSMSTGSIVSWYWHFDTDTSTIQNPLYTFTSSGTHTVTLLVSNGNCVDSVVTPVFINPSPVAGFTFTPLCHDSVSFVQTSTVAPGGISDFNWDFGDVTTSIVANPYHVYADTGMYIVTLFVRSDSGCTASIFDTVHVVKCKNDIIIVIGEPAVPSGFTPNGDGSNDILYVKGGPFNSLDFRIFNEWGNQIFHSDIQSTGWDGTYKSALQPGGRFIWTVNGELIDGRKIKMAGEVILNR